MCFLLAGIMWHHVPVALHLVLILLRVLNWIDSSFFCRLYWSGSTIVPTKRLAESVVRQPSVCNLRLISWPTQTTDELAREGTLDRRQHQSIQPLNENLGLLAQTFGGFRTSHTIYYFKALLLATSGLAFLNTTIIRVFIPSLFQTPFSQKLQLWILLMLTTQNF